MTLEEFKSTLTSSSLPTALPASLQAMWYEARGDWDSAHDIAQNIHNKEGAWIHAYLHRVEGDKQNSSYWYHQAKHDVPTYSTKQEWEEITSYFLEKEVV